MQCRARGTNSARATKHLERLVEGVKRSEIEKTLSSRIEQMERFYGKSVDLDKYGKHLYTLVARLPNMMSKAESYLQQFKK